MDNIRPASTNVECMLYLEVHAVVSTESIAANSLFLQLQLISGKS